MQTKKIEFSETQNLGGWHSIHLEFTSPQFFHCLQLGLPYSTPSTPTMPSVVVVVVVVVV